MHDPSASKRIILDCLLSDAERKSANETSFFDAIQSLDIAECAAFARGLNMSPQLYAEISRVPSLKEYAAAIFVDCTLQEQYTDALHQSLSQLNRALGKSSFDLVPLKGISLWGSVYERPSQRICRDLDLLIDSSENIIPACDVIKDLGYEYQGSNLHDDIADKDRYELQEFVAERPIPDGMYEVLGRGHRFLFPGIDEVTTRDSTIWVRLELHKAPFLYEDASHPAIDCSDLKNHPLYPRMKHLPLAFSVGYLAMKFVQDTEELLKGDLVKTKSFKLLHDTRLILSVLDRRSKAEAVELANKYGTAPYLRAVLSILMPLNLAKKWTGIELEETDWLLDAYTASPDPVSSLA